MDVAEQIRTTEEELYATTKNLIEAHRAKAKLAKALGQAHQQLEQASKRVTSLTHENQRLRDLLKKHGIDVSNE